MKLQLLSSSAQVWQVFIFVIIVNNHPKLVLLHSFSHLSDIICDYFECTLLRATVSVGELEMMLAPILLFHTGVKTENIK